MPLNNFLRCIHVASIFPAFLWFYIWFHRGLLKSCAPHPMEARSTKQVHGAKKQRPSSETINLAVEKNFRGSRTNSCRSTKNIPTGSRKHIGKSPTFFVTLGPKKNLVRSKKHVQVKKKDAQVQKTCIPIIYSSFDTTGSNKHPKLRTSQHSHNLQRCRLSCQRRCHMVLRWDRLRVCGAGSLTIKAKDRRITLHPPTVCL